MLRCVLRPPCRLLPQDSRVALSCCFAPELAVARPPAPGSTVLHRKHVSVFAGSPKARRIFRVLSRTDYEAVSSERASRAPAQPHANLLQCSTPQHRPAAPRKTSLHKTSTCQLYDRPCGAHTDSTAIFCVQHHLSQKGK